MNALVDLLAHNELILLFTIIGIGSAIGRVSVKGVSLGPAAVLFFGLVVSGLYPQLKVGDAISTFGLVLFTYVVGVATGPAFVAGLRGKGLRAVLVVTGAAVSCAAVIGVAGRVLGIPALQSAGSYTGTMTNTPALGVVMQNAGANGSIAAVGYALSYPAGVLGALLGTTAVLRRSAKDKGDVDLNLVRVTVEVTDGHPPPLGELGGDHVTFGRVAHDGIVAAAVPGRVVEPGDLVTVVGPVNDVDEVVAALGRPVETDLAHDRSRIDFRRITVSSSKVVGHRLGDLDLHGRFGASATRLRRGDVDMVASEDHILNAGDRIRVVAPADQLPAIARLLGDSEGRLADIDFTAFSIGLIAGALLGLVPFPGGISFGMGGGALVSGLIFGAFAQIGPLRFTLGHQSSVVLRYIGTVIFLAAIGLRSGPAFFASAFTLDGLRVVGMSIIGVATVVLVTCSLARRFLKMEGAEMAGAIAGVQTQPGVLAAAEKASADDPAVPLGYTTVYPAAMVIKILVAQLLGRIG